MVRRALFWSYFAQFAVFLVTFWGSVLIARILSPHDLGLYGVAMATIGIIQTFAALNVGTYVVRAPELTEHVMKSAFTVNAITNIALSLLTFLMGSVGARFLAEPAVAPIIEVLAIMPLFGIVTFQPSIMLQRELRFRGTSILSIAGAMTYSIVTVASAYLGCSYMSPAYGAIAGGLVPAIGVGVIGRQHLKIGVSFAQWRAIAAFGLRLMSINGVSTVSARLSDLVIARLLGVTSLGIYNRAASLNNLIAQNTYGAATRVIFVKLSEAQREEGQIAEVFTRSYRMVSGIMGPIFAGLGVLAQPLIFHLYGNKWSSAAPLLSLAMLAQVLALSFAMNWELFVVRDRLAFQTRLEVTRSIIFVALVAAASTVSLTAVAWAGVVQALVSALIYARLMPGLAGVPWRRIVGMYGETAVLTLLAIAPAAATMTAFHWDPHVPLVTLSLSVLCGVGLWLAALFAAQHPLGDEIRHLSGRMGKLATAR